MIRSHGYVLVIIHLELVLCVCVACGSVYSTGNAAVKGSAGGGVALTIIV